MDHTLSLCVIARDEAAQIRRCLASARPFVDQMVIVDTGSEDNTMAIAKQMGAETYSSPWQDDFSLARNASLDHATGEWILFLDCDEELDPATGAELRKVIKDGNYDGYWLKCTNTFQERLSSSFLAFRLFRNHPLHRFEMPVHEQILPSILKHSSPERIGQISVHIIHHGYEENQVHGKDKSARNIRLLAKARQRYGETGFIAFNLGAEAQRTEDYSLALDYYSRALAKSDLNASYTPVIVRSMLHCLTSLKRHQEALALAARYEAHYPDYTDLVFYAGMIHADLGHLQEALDCMNRCLAMGAPPLRYFSLHGIGDNLPRSTIQRLVGALIDSAVELGKQGERSQAFANVALAFEQLRNTPDEEAFLKLAEAMGDLWRSVERS